MYPTIWLIRHSVREDRKNTQGISETDCSISEEGVKLAEETGHNLSKQIKTVDKIYVSPFKRTIETGYILASKFKDTATTLEISCDISEVLIEYYMQHMDIKLPDHLKKLLESKGISMPEPKDKVFKRCKDFIDSLNVPSKSNSNLLVVTHGGVINIILKQLFPAYSFDIETRCTPDKYIPRYCDYVAVQFLEDKWRVVTSNWFTADKS